MKDIDIKAGKVLRRERTLRGYSQSDLADYLGITFQQIQKYEKGTNRMSISTLFAICEFLRIAPENFISKVGGDVVEEVQDLSGINDFLAIPVKIRTKLLSFYYAVNNDIIAQR